MANPGPGTWSGRARRASCFRGRSEKTWPGVVGLLLLRRLLPWWRLTVPCAAAKAVAQKFLDLRGVPDHVDAQLVVPRVDDDRADLQDSLGERLMQVYPLELRVGDHLRVLVQDPVLANDLVVRDDVANRLALKFRREEREEGEEQEEPGEDEAEIDPRDRIVQDARTEEPGDVETEYTGEDERSEERRVGKERRSG